MEASLFSPFLSYLLFHNLIEIISIVVCMTLFILTWNTRGYPGNDYLKFIGVGYAFIALIDLLHTLAYKGMTVFPGYGSNLPTQLWIAARYLQAVTLCAAPLFIARRLDDRALLGGFAVAVLGLAVWVFSGTFPDCYIEGKGLTAFKIGSEYAITAALLAALYLLFRKRDRFKRSVYILVASSIGCTAVSEISFTAYLGVYDFANATGHLLKLAAFYLLYRAILVTGLKDPFELIFRELKQSEKALQGARDHLEEQVGERTAELSVANANLIQEVAVRQRAEEALRVRERELNESQRVAHVGSWDWDATTDTIWWSDEYFHIYSIDPKLPTPNYIDHLKVYTPESRERLDAAVNRTMQTGETYELDLELADTSGPTRWICARGEAKRDSGGRIRGLRGTAQDITERKQAEETLTESEKKYRTLFEETFDGLFITSPEGRIIDMNRKGVAIFGYDTKKEILNLDLARDIYAYPPDRARILAMVNATGTAEYEVVVKKKSGEKMTAYCSLTAVRDEKGSVSSYRGIIRDITERKAVEEALRESEQKYRLLVANADEAIFIAQDGVVKFPNPKALEMTGYSTEELACVPFTDLIHPEDRGTVLERHIDRLRGGTPPETYPLRIVGKAGKEIWAQLTAVPIDWEGRPGVLCFLRDITKERSLEAQFLQSQKMEAVGRLAGGIAHDFNNLLTVTLGYCDLALTRIGALDPLRRDLEEIRKASDRCAALTRQLLAFSRKQILVPKVIHLGDVVAEMDKMLRRLIGEDIDLVSVRGKDLGNVKADPGQIEQVIVNLAVNARDAMPRGGKLTIETANVELDETYARGHQYVSPGSYVMLAVSDTGSRNGRRDVGADLRALLHDEGEGEGDRPRSFDRLRDREAERRAHQRVQRAGDRDDVQDVLPARRGAGDRDLRGGRPPIGRIARQRNDPGGGGRRAGPADGSGDPGAVRVHRAGGPERRRSHRSLLPAPGDDPPDADGRGDARDERGGAVEAVGAHAAGDEGAVHVGVYGQCDRAPGDSGAWRRVYP